MSSPRLALDYMTAAQSQKEVTANEWFAALDALCHPNVLDRDLTAPPGSESEGDLYIVATGGSGDWAGQDGKLALYTNGAYAFFTPGEGFRVWVADEDQAYHYYGSAWVSEATYLLSRLAEGNGISLAVVDGKLEISVDVATLPAHATSHETGGGDLVYVNLLEEGTR